MAKYIAYSPNGTAFECDTLAEARSVEGKQRNPSSQAGLLKRMRDDGCDTFAKKVKWVRKHMPHIDDPQSFVGWVVKAERNPRRKVSAAQQSLFDAPVRSRRGASECGAVLVGKRWHSPPPAKADVTECASTLAHTRWGTKRRNPADKHLAHERQEESYFATLLDSLPVGQTVTLGSGCRVRKLSKGYVIVNGERLTTKQGAKMLHRGHL